MGDWIQMDITKKGTSLRTVFLEYLISIAAGLAAALALFGGLMVLGERAGVYIPANHSESILLRNKELIAASNPFDASLLPKDCTYALISKNHTILQSNMSEAEQSASIAYIKDQNQVVSGHSGSYMMIERKDDVCVVHYYVLPRYTNAWMNEHLPDVNTLSWILLIALVLPCCTIITFKWAKRLERQLKPILDASKRIAEKDLDFEVEPTGVSEFNTILQGMSDMKTALKDSLQSQWRMEENRKEQISALAHDIKTPLTIVKGNAELLEKTGLQEKQKEYAQYIQKNSLRIEQYAKALIEINKSEQLDTVRRMDISASRFIQRLKQTAAEMAELKQTTVLFHEYNIPENLHIDPELIERAFANVVSNALDYNPGDKPIEICFEGRAADFRIQVEDHGEGFLEEGLLKADQQFYRGDQSRHASNHYGIGLYFAKNVLSAHKGKLIFENKSEEPGARVTLSIPAIGTINPV